MLNLELLHVLNQGAKDQVAPLHTTFVRRCVLKRRVERNLGLQLDLFAPA